MGTIKQGILGGFSGKVGTVIGSTWKGITYMRGIALKIKNPKTDLQIAQRQKWSVTMKFLKAFTLMLQDSYRFLAVKMSAFNAAFQEIIDNALQGTYPNIAVDFPNAMLAKGSLPGALNATAASTVAATIAVTWLDNAGDLGALDTDTATIAVYSPAKNEAVVVSGLATRVSNSQAVTVPSSFSGDLVHVYIYFNSADKKLVSNSAYAGAVTVA